MTTIAIIGAGFCGTALAVQLLRQPPVLPLKIVLINRSGLLARGVAYGTRAEQHVLNVPAARMSALPDDPDGFLRYVRAADDACTGASFVPRRMYGDYLEQLLTQAAMHAPIGCRFRAIVGDVARIRPDGHGRAELLLANGDRLIASRVVLALGHHVPADPALPGGDRAFYSSPRYVRDPWRPDALWGIKPQEPLLLLGTGLTMLDVVLDLRARGHQAGIHALSRRGLLPLAHRALDTSPSYDESLVPRLLATPTARHYTQALRCAVAEAAARGIDWRNVVGALRADTPALWQALPLLERRRFLRHLRPYWDAHRHRSAPELHQRLQLERDGGRLQSLAARLLGLHERVDGVDVELRRRGKHSSERLAVGAVINCTGPDSNTLRPREPLVSALIADGLAAADPLGLGLQIDERYALQDAQGHSHCWLRYVGPMLRVRDWEATAVPELSRHVARLAQQLREEFAVDGSRPEGAQWML